MNRKDFFSEMNRSLLETLKVISEPFIEEKLNQIDRATDELLQIRWMVVTEDLEYLRDSQSTIISGKNIIFVRNEEEIIALDGSCPTCKHLLMYTWQKELKCYHCDETYSTQGDGEKQMKRYLLKKTDDQYLIGIPKL